MEVKILQEGQPFSFQASGIAVFKALFKEPNFLTKDILFEIEIKLTFSGAASSMLHEVSFN